MAFTEAQLEAAIIDLLGEVIFSAKVDTFFIWQTKQAGNGCWKTACF
jgi:hypothetical protein